MRRDMINPAQPGTNRGPQWALTLHDHLPLPSGQRLGEVDSETLRREFSRLQIPGFNHSLGRQVAIELYAAHLKTVAKARADAATAQWLQKNRG